MKQLLEFKTEDGQDFYVELDEDRLPPAPVRGFSPEEKDRGVVQNTILNFERSLGPLKSITSSIVSSVKDIPGGPDEMEVELGLKFNAKAGIIVTTLEGEANLKVILKWNRKTGPQ